MIGSTGIGAVTINCPFSQWLSGACLPGCGLADYLMNTCNQQIDESIANVYETARYGVTVPVPPNPVGPNVPNLDITGNILNPDTAVQETYNTQSQYVGNINDFLNAAGVTGQPTSLLPSADWMSNYGFYIIVGALVFLVMEKI
jgi:hypothetical protein